MNDIGIIAKLLLNITDSSQDDLILVLTEVALRDAEKYTKNSDINLQENLLAQMTQYLYNNLNNEGLASQSLATVSESYINGANAYPPSIMLALRGFTKLKTL